MDLNQIWTIDCKHYLIQPMRVQRVQKRVVECLEYGKHFDFIRCTENFQYFIRNSWEVNILKVLTPGGKGELNAAGEGGCKGDIFWLFII